MLSKPIHLSQTEESGISYVGVKSINIRRNAKTEGSSLGPYRCWGAKAWGANRIRYNGSPCRAAWLSSARVVRCLVKSYNERNPRRIDLGGQGNLVAKLGQVWGDVERLGTELEELRMNRIAIGIWQMLQVLGVKMSPKGYNRQIFQDSKIFKDELNLEMISYDNGGSNNGDGDNIGDGVKTTGGVIGSGGEIGKIDLGGQGNLVDKLGQVWGDVERLGTELEELWMSM
ncbi:hypothetical protein Tco_0653724 [Tanacetum coccineum]|uniref:Uncharacterized protein n=1 Tax=Tanacetum coccineum TaxID=301880 RepID=A0ABQ4X1P0_9ASTR